MPEFQVKCINRSSAGATHEHITHIGNAQANWRLTREEAVKRIDERIDAFYTLDIKTNTRIYIGVVREGRLQTPYLRTHAEGRWSDNLLALQMCPGNVPIIA